MFYLAKISNYLEFLICFLDSLEINFVIFSIFKFNKYLNLE